MGFRGLGLRCNGSGLRVFWLKDSGFRAEGSRLNRSSCIGVGFRTMGSDLWLCGWGLGSFVQISSLFLQAPLRPDYAYHFAVLQV